MWGVDFPDWVCQKCCMKKFLLFLIFLAGGVFGLFGAENVKAYDLPEIYIKAINPGYTKDGILNVGEMIEIGRKNSDDPISLAGLSIGYINSSGNSSVIADLSKYIWAAGETILLQLASSPSSELAQVRYSKTLAFKAGPLTLMRGEEVLDSVCWTGGEGCVVAFNSARPTSLVRNLETFEFEHVGDYEPGNGGVLEMVDDDFGAENLEPASVCKGVVFSEILSY